MPRTTCLSTPTARQLMALPLRVSTSACASDGGMQHPPAWMRSPYMVAAADRMIPPSALLGPG